MPLNALFITEGTGGHFLPAWQTAQVLASEGAHVDFWYAGRKAASGWIDQVVQSEGGKNLHAQQISGLTTSWRAPGDFLGIWRKTLRHLRSHSVNAVVGFGGRISLPVIGAALRYRLGGKKVGIVLHEQNAELGKANRLLCRWADHLALSFPLTHPVPKRVSFSYTGMPIRFASEDPPEKKSREGFHLLVLGGSQGSRSVNRLVADTAAMLNPEQQTRWRITHLTGEADCEWVREHYRQHGVHAEVAASAVDMDVKYQSADIVISRAGASTVAELARFGLPSVLIPYPFAAGHQESNARVLEKCGAAFMLKERQSSPRRLLKILSILDRDVQHRLYMGARAGECYVPRSAQRLAQVISDHRFPRPLREENQQSSEVTQPKEIQFHGID